MPTPLQNHSDQTGSSEAKAISAAWLEEFEAAARRPLATRMKYAFIRTYKPVLDDEPFRAFDTMEDYVVGATPLFPLLLALGFPIG